MIDTVLLLGGGAGNLNQTIAGEPGLARISKYSPSWFIGTASHLPSCDSALSALGRIGKPSLPKKVAHRIGVVQSQLGAQFPDLLIVATTAVKCRNFLVHGSSGDVDYAKVERFVPFLTDALEFIFAASDFVEAGWDAQAWVSGAGGWGHSFSRFRSEYDRALALLRVELEA